MFARSSGVGGRLLFAPPFCRRPPLRSRYSPAITSHGTSAGAGVARRWLHRSTTTFTTITSPTTATTTPTTTPTTRGRWVLRLTMATATALLVTTGAWVQASEWRWQRLRQQQLQQPLPLAPTPALPVDSQDSGMSVHPSVRLSVVGQCNRLMRLSRPSSSLYPSVPPAYSCYRYCYRYYSLTP